MVAVDSQVIRPQGVDGDQDDRPGPRGFSCPLIFRGTTHPCADQSHEQPMNAPPQPGTTLRADPGFNPWPLHSGQPPVRETAIKVVWDGCPESMEVRITARVRPGLVA